MAFDIEPSDAPRKTLDEIRQEIEAEYGDSGRLASPVQDDVPETSDVDAEMVEGDRVPARARHAPPGGGRRRLTYIVAALVGCIIGQVLLIMALKTLGYGIRPRVPLPQIAVRANESTPAPFAIPLLPEDAPPMVPPASATAAPSTPRTQVREPESGPPPSVSGRGNSTFARKPRAPSHVAVSAVASPNALVADALTPHPEPVRPEDVVATSDRSDARAAVRSAFEAWLRTLPSDDGPVQATEPIIVLSADGRGARTYVSVSSPTGLVPRVQRWRLDEGGWILVTDRQAGSR